MTGFLGTRGSLFSDISLILQVLTTLFFTIGYFLDRRKGKHCIVMGAAAATNTFFVLSYMATRLLREEVPEPPAQYLSLYQSIVIPHGILSTLVLILAVSQAILARYWRKKTGDTIALGKRRLTHRRLGFTSLVLWYVSFASGILVYAILYVL